MTSDDLCYIVSIGLCQLKLLTINNGDVDNQDCQVPVKEIPTANAKANHFEKNTTWKLPMLGY